jgi:hypothetical protein
MLGMAARRGPTAQLAVFAVLMALLGALPTVGKELVAMAATFTVGALVMALLVSRRLRCHARRAVVRWWSAFGFLAPAWRPLLPAAIAALVAAAGGLTGALASSVVFPATAITLGIVGGISVLPVNPMRGPAPQITSAILALVQLIVAAIVVLMVVAVVDWLLAGTLYAADSIMLFPVAFAFALAGVVASGWYLNARQLPPA